ncbi:unnamed protein product [Closterium sp. NIES-64]|nr:unnamed protein product [Closterium sp. NIES-64]
MAGRALHYEVLRGAVGTGAHVRDAAAYVFWASPTPSHRPSLLPPCNSFALPSLPLRGVTARWAAVTARWAAVTARGAAVTARWAAVTARGAGQGGDAVESGAKEEEQWAPAGGIAIVNAADVTSLSSTRTSFTHVPTTAAPVRLRSRNHSHPPLPHLHMHMHHCQVPDPPFRHGALLATAALLPPLSASSPSCALTGTLSSLTSSLPSLLAPRSFRGRLAADLKVACCRLLSALAAALPRAHLPPLPVPALTAATACLHDMLAGDGGELQCARARFVSLVQEAAAAALWDLARSQLFPACTHLVHQIVTCHAATLESTSSAATGLGVGGANTGQEDGERHGGTEGRGGEGGVDKGEMSRYELAERVVKALCAAATNNRGRRAVSDVAVRAAAVEALGNAASIIPLLQAGGAGARGHAGTGGGAGTQVGEGEKEEGEKEEVELRRQRGLVGLGWWEEGGESVVGALLRAAQDYTEDQRGDVGRLVREASMKALVGWVGEMYRLREVGEGDVGDGGGAAEASLPHGVPSPALPTTHDASSQQQRYIGMREWCRAVAGRVVGVLMKQAGEKIDGTREVAGQGLQRLLWGGKHGAVFVGMRETREEAWTGEAVETCGAGGSTLGTSGGGEEGRDGGGSVRQCVGGRAEGSGVCRDVDGWEQLRQHVPSDSHFAWKVHLLLIPTHLWSSRIHLHHFPSLPPLPSTPRISRLSFHAAPLLLLPAYRLPLLSGLLLSAGALSHSLTAASLRALLSLKQELGAQGGTREAGEGGRGRQWEEVQGQIAEDVVVLLRRHRKQTRVIILYIKEEELCRPQPTASVPKVLGAVDLLCHLAAPLCSARCHALSTLLWLIAVRFPTVSSPHSPLCMCTGQSPASPH